MVQHHRFLKRFSEQKKVVKAFAGYDINLFFLFEGKKEDMGGN